MASMQIPWSSGAAIRSQGEEIYEVAGSDRSPALVLCHGGAGNHAVWFRQVLFFAPHFRVITWDQRGLGNSTNRAGKATPESALVDLVALLDALGIARAQVVGQSMGGWPAMALTLRRPARVSSLVLTSSLGGIPVPQWLTRPRLPRRSQPIAGEHPAFSARLEIG